jgi:tRNA pseudouridine55 synthase
MTSREAVNCIQRWFPRKTKLGHTGTLDPLATGVLVICVGVATRLADYVQMMEKTYVSRFRLGATSTTDDADGEITETPNVTVPSREQVEAALKAFIGTIEQTPPAFSALKVAGRRAHDLARKGEEVELRARPVRIDAIRVLNYKWPWLHVEIDCGKGTYIRSIARDLSAKLGVGGMVQTLRRTRIGPFTAEQGIGLDADSASVKLRPMVEAVPHFVQVQLAEKEVNLLRQGGRVRTPEQDLEGIAVLNEAGELVVLGVSKNGWLYPKTVLG